STISQLAYMVAALGVGAYTASVFHIWTHAWFKALLFLGAGSISHAVGTFSMSRMGGLRRQMPTTFKTYVIGSLTLAGIFPLAGSWSKDDILLGASHAAWVRFGEVEHSFNLALAVASTLVAVGGLSIGWAIFRLRRVNVDLARSPLAWLYRALERRFYFDDLYYATVVRPVSGPIARAAYWTNQKVLDGAVNLAGLAAVKLGRGVYYGIDQPVIDGAVNGLGAGTEAAGGGLKFWQSGNVQLYAASLFVGIAVLVGVFLVKG